MPGQNGYAANLLNGGRMNNETCLRPWDSVVPGVPDGYIVGGNESGRPLEIGEVRPSIMKALTQHNPSVCLSDDDLEGLNVLYPSCTHSFSTPVCDKVNYNIGWVRLGVWIVAPMLLAMLLLICIFSHASGKQNARLDEQIKQRRRRSVELNSANSDIANLTKSQEMLEGELKKQKKTEAQRIQMEVERELNKRTKKLIREHRAANGGNGDTLDDDAFEHAIENMLRRDSGADHHFKSGTIGHQAEKVTHMMGRAWKDTKGGFFKAFQLGSSMEASVGKRFHFGKKKRFVDKDGDGIDDNTGLSKDEHVRAIAEEHFVDADGDGIDDNTNLNKDQYLKKVADDHEMSVLRKKKKFVDKDGDGIDDKTGLKRFVDADGDGIDDNSGLDKKEYAKKIAAAAFVDADGDGIDDDTGLDRDALVQKVAEDQEPSSSSSDDEDEAPGAASSSTSKIRVTIQK